MQNLNVSKRELAVLDVMCDWLGSEGAAGFRHINSYVRNRYGERDGCEPWNIRRVVRALARKGLVEFHRGLMDDDGRLMGSGYGVTDKALQWWWNKDMPLPPPPEAGTVNEGEK